MPTGIPKDKANSLKVLITENKAAQGDSDR